MKTGAHAGLIGRVRARIAAPRRRTPQPDGSGGPVPIAVPDQPGFTLFHVAAARDRWLCVGLAGLEMGDAPGIVLCVLSGAPQCSFLIALDGRSFAIDGDGLTGQAISVRLRRQEDGRVELRHPLAPTRYLGVVFTAPAPRPERVIFDRTGHPVLDRLTLHPAGDVGDAVRDMARELALAALPILDARRVMTLLQAGRVRLGLAETLLRLLPAGEMQVLAARLMDHADDMALLRRAMPGDPWIGGTLPALLAWCAQGRPATRQAVSAAGETQAGLLQSGTLRPQLGLAVTAMARRTVSPRRVACVLATARNEGPYLLDWLAHHRAVGFDHAVIYSNDNDDGSDELLGLLADHGEITWVRNELAPGARAQWKAYGHAFKMLPDLLDFQWTMVLDLDEYFGCQPGLFASVAEFVGWQECQNVDAIALRWLSFCAGTQDVWHDAPSTQRFTRREPAVGSLFKSLVRSRLFWDSHCHFPFPTMGQDFAYRLEDGSVCHHMGLVRGEKMPKDTETAGHAWVAHHAYRSAAEALIKVARGDATWQAGHAADAERGHVIVRRFVALAGRTDLVVDARTLACAPGMAAVRARLLALPGIACCDAAIKQGFARRLEMVSREFLGRSIGPGQTAYTAFRGILAGQVP